jgi:S-(hydroxymethyl)mycothiol dehydrogenase
MTPAARGVVVRQPGAPVRVEEFRLDPPGPGEVLVRIKACGVCHTDLHASRGDFGDRFPYLLGHEATATVEAAGEGVDAPQVGSTVALTWRAPCGRCRRCAAGDPVRCLKPATARPRASTADGLVLGRVLGLGTLATHAVVAAAQAISIDAGLPADATCLIGCSVATGVGSALYTAAVARGDTVAVFGCGAVGLSVVQGAVLAGASRIFAVDLHERKLAWARQFGATDPVDARAGDPVAAIRRATGETGVTAAFDAVGLPSTLAQALASTDVGGRTVLIGVPTATAELALSLPAFFYARGDLRASFFGDCLPDRDFARILGWYRAGAIKLNEMVTERIALDEVPRAFEAMERGESLRSVVVFE